MIIVVCFALLLASATVCAVCKMGEKEGICKYGYTEEDKTN